MEDLQEVRLICETDKLWFQELPLSLTAWHKYKGEFLRKILVKTFMNQNYPMFPDIHILLYLCTLMAL